MDIEALKQDYCAGELSIQKVADKHSIAKTTLRDVAKKHGWARQKAPPKSSVQNENGRADKQMGGRTGGREKPQAESSGRKPTKAASPPDDEPQFNPDEFGLSEQQGLFAEHVAAGKKLVEAYRQAGYKADGNAAYATASQLLRNPKVSRAIRWLRDRRQKRLALTEAEIIHQLSSIASMDANAISQVRRVNCRYCWGDDHCYQWRDVDEYERACSAALAESKAPPLFDGGVGFVSSTIPNDECPRCGGEGIMETFFHDTTQLDGPERWAYLGVEENKFGVKVHIASPEAARKELLAYLKATRGAPSSGGAGQVQSKEALELDGLRLRNEKMEAEIERIRTGDKESSLIVVHNALQIPGAVQPTDEGE